MLQHEVHERMVFFSAEAEAGRNHTVGLKGKKCVLTAKRVQTAHELDIYIKVKAALVFDDLQAGVIGEKRVLFLFTAHFGITVLVNVEIIFVPFQNHIVRAVLAPTLYALFGFVRQWCATKPAVMDDFRDHTASFCALRSVRAAIRRIKTESPAPSGVHSIVSTFFGERSISAGSFARKHAAS